MPQLLFSVTLKQSLTLSHLPGMHIGNLFRNKELISMLLPQFLIVGSKHCEIHELSTFLWALKSQDFLPCIYLILVRLHLGDWGDTKGPHLDSVGSYLPFLFNRNNCVCWFLTKMMTFPLLHSPETLTPEFFDPDNWQLWAGQEDKLRDCP